MSCGVHGVTVAAVPWARHQSGHTLFLDDQVAWLATQTSKTAITVLMRIAWRTVGAIITRVGADTGKQFDQFAGPTDLAMLTLGGHKPVLPAGFNPRKNQESLIYASGIAPTVRN